MTIQIPYTRNLLPGYVDEMAWGRRIYDLQLFNPNALCYPGSSLAINAVPNGTDLKVAVVLQAPKTGSITALSYTCVKTVLPPTYEIRMETTDPSTSDNFEDGPTPSGTLWDTTTNATFSPTTNQHWVTMTSAANVTAGDIFAVVIQYSSGTCNNTHYAQFASYGRYYPSSYDLLCFPIPLTHSTTWGPDQAIPACCAKYSDGEIIPGCTLLNNPGATALGGISPSINFTDASAIDEYATTWIQPFDAKFSGYILKILFEQSLLQLE